LFSATQSPRWRTAYQVTGLLLEKDVQAYINKAQSPRCGTKCSTREEREERLHLFIRQAIRDVQGTRITYMRTRLQGDIPVAAPPALSGSFAQVRAAVQLPAASLMLMKGKVERPRAGARTDVQLRPASHLNC
jgi:hypothetical protein